MAAGAHLSLCLFNLLPVRPLDGGRALALGVSALAGPAAGEGAARWAGALTALTLGALSLWLMGRTGGSLWLLPAAAGLLGFFAGGQAPREALLTGFSVGWACAAAVHALATAWFGIRERWGLSSDSESD